MKKKAAVSLFSGIAIIFISIIFLGIFIYFATNYFGSLEDGQRMKQNQNNLSLINDAIIELKNSSIGSFKEITINPYDSITINQDDTITIVQQIKNKRSIENLKEEFDIGNLKITKQERSITYILDYNNIVSFNNVFDIMPSSQKLRFKVIDIENGKRVLSVIRSSEDILVEDVLENTVLLQNNHFNKTYTIIGYSIELDSEHGSFNEIIYLDTPLVVEKKDFFSLDLFCYPQRTFILKLYTQEKEAPFLLNITTNDYDFSKCSSGMNISILSPENNYSFDYGEEINFLASVDNNTGDYTCSWTSDVDGNLNLSYVSAEGGEVTDTEIEGQWYRIHAFKDVGEDSFNVTQGGEVDVLVVGGGGGGGVDRDSGGGAGAGGLIFEENYYLSTENIFVYVGNGGNGFVGSGSNFGSGENGLNSFFKDINAIGGGGGGYRLSGLLGGSGGGAGAGSRDGATTPGGNGATSQGNNGGSSFNHSTSGYSSSGGGGGAGSAGENSPSSNAGNGGEGLYFGNIFGNNFGENGWFAGGGGGGASYLSGLKGSGGLGGGGDGGKATGHENGSGPGENGIVNTGGGAGGSGTRNTGTKGGNGGSGIVLVRYQIPYENYSSQDIIDNCDINLSTLSPGNHTITLEVTDELNTTTDQINLEIGPLNTLVTNGLQLYLDSTEEASFNPTTYNSIINTSTWSLGTGSATNFTKNGDIEENERVMAETPFGKTDVVWETRPTGNSQGDGGWNTALFEIDNTKLYRFSVWVRRTSSTSSGSFYLGLRGYNASTNEGVKPVNSSTINTNPYFDSRAISNFTQNQWYLVVGHVYPHNTSVTTRHTNTGIYNTSGTKVFTTTSVDYKWLTTTTHSLHRTYHYYSTSSTPRLQFYSPKVELVDGTESTITDLVNGFNYYWKDLSGNNNHAKLFKGANFLSTSNINSIDLDGTSGYADFSKQLTLLKQGGTLSFWIKRDDLINSSLLTFQQNSYFSHIELRNNYFFTETKNNCNIFDSPQFLFNKEKWHFITVKFQNNNSYWYLNGQLLGETTNYGVTNCTEDVATQLLDDFDFRYIGINTVYSESYNGKLSSLFLYNRALTDQEIYQNYLYRKNIFKELSIVSPENNSFHLVDENISFKGSYDHYTKDYSCSWTSSIDGEFSTECDVNISSLSQGEHTITLEVTAGTEILTKDINITLNNLSVLKTGAGTGTVTSSPTGIDCGSTCFYSFDPDTSVTLSASASTGSTFEGWSGEDCSGTGTCTVILSQARKITANFTLNTYSLTVSKTGTGEGTIISSPSGIDCGDTCSYDFNYNASVTLTASATSGSSFTGWSGEGCSGTGDCVVSMTQARNVIANFELQRTLTVLKTGSGVGIITSSPSGINCGSTCSANYNYGVSVILSASATTGSNFTGWSGEGCSGTSTCTVTMDQAKNVTANFELQRTLTVLKTGSGVGIITSSPSGINCGSNCSKTYSNGTSVTLTANPLGSNFIGWSGEGCSGTGTCVVSMTQARSVVAEFENVNYQFVSATGGTTSDINVGGQIYRLHVFTTIGDNNFEVISDGNIEYLIVAGGGAGGSAIWGAGGGGGAGGVLEGILTVTSKIYNVNVGSGGVRNTSGNKQGGNGGNSYIDDLIALGGGGGGGFTGTTSSLGLDGGSGGGGPGTSWVANSGGSGLSVLGNNGGRGYNNSITAYRASGGGGGASQIGASASYGSGGNGGNGIASAISGSLVYYAGGGGGGGSYSVGSGGLGGGANGRSIHSTSANGYNGVTNTGGGGGGIQVSGTSSNSGGGGNGGSGIVIIRYPIPS
jgi:hypothetical protein